MEINKPAFTTVVLLIALTIFFIFSFPKYQESMNLEVELAKKQHQYDARVDYYLKFSDILEDIEKEQDSLEKVKSALPPNFDFAQVIFFLQEKAKETKLNIKSINFSQLKSSGKLLSSNPSDEIQDIIFGVELAGSYQSFKNFLYALEKSARLFEVNSIAFTSEQVSSASKLKNATQSYNFTLGIQARTY